MEDKERWDNVYSSTIAYKVDLVKAVLKDHGIECVVINKQDSMNHFLNSSINIKLFVRKEQLFKANHIIKQNNL